MRAKGCGWPLEAGKGKERRSPLELLKGAPHYVLIVDF